ncbi:PREDICTED: uncharacterized protein LOC108371373 [Rhagoletis zephyria]|uniref:uncharacterized protein LOC108371373 n=1 Tax=Rhagoletis zephyria TaxID=28612 RepID=UPI0008119618|nr:PREDICTED: uncharacterized protein LOC108371373 [Rhagoletis zephyria]
MQEIWCFFKLLEVLLGIGCLTFHVLGFVQTDPLPHNLFYCGTFASFTVYSLLGILNICCGRGRNEIMEAIPTTLGALAHFGASLLSMYHAENDFQLLFLSDFEEPRHPFFFYCKAQSIAALATGGMYMLHATFAFDALFIRPEPQRPEEGMEDVEIEEEIEMVPRHRRPIEMFVLGRLVHTKLMSFKWFQMIAAKP